MPQMPEVVSRGVLSIPPPRCQVSFVKLQKLSLTYFRNYKIKEFEFDQKVNLVIGPNTAGKTNLMEAIYLLAAGNSFRATRETEMISYEEELSRIEGIVAEGTELEIVLTTGKIQGKRVPKKLYKINGVGKRKSDFVGNLKMVLFRPEDINLILGSPSKRRDYLNDVLSSVNSEYGRSLLSYKKGLRQRNKLLDKIREAEAQGSQLLFWNKLLIKDGGFLTEAREGFINFLNKNLKKLNIEYDKSLMTQERLDKYQTAELALGATLVGPHRDEIKFKRKNENNHDLALYGSRGEQRMAVLALKFLELRFIEQQTGERPVLLLDDIFSELDKKHQKQIIKIVPFQQTILTSTDALVRKFFSDKIKVIKL